MTTATKPNKPLAALADDPAPVETPNDLLDQEYPGLSEKLGMAFDFVIKKRTYADTQGQTHRREMWIPTDLNERFFAALLTEEANKTDPAVFDQEENRWFRFDSGVGFYCPVKPEVLQEKLAVLLFDIAKKCRQMDVPVDVHPLEFKFRKTSTLAPIVTKAIGIACVKGDFWDRPPLLVPLRNGIYDLEENCMYRHSPFCHFRGVIEADYNLKAGCPRWRDFVSGALDQEDDRVLLQKIFGLLMMGKNVPQIMLLMCGKPQSGKGTIARIMSSLVGTENTGTLRTDRLNERFELGRLRHKLLIYGPDVSENFLNVAGAHLLKCITGEDPISPEYKNSNATPAAKPIPGLPVVTSNSNLRIRFEGDKDAWRRRLVVIRFENGIEEADRIVSLSETLMREEGSGILNYALEGVKMLLKDDCNVRLTERQQHVRDKLLDESESYVAFAREGIIQHDAFQLTTDQAWKGYVNFCTSKGWAPVTPQRFRTGFNQAVVDVYAITQSHDLQTSSGTCRGWYGIKLLASRRSGIP